VAFASAVECHFAGARHAKTFGYRFSGFNSLGTSHMVCFRLTGRRFSLSGQIIDLFEFFSRQSAQLVPQLHGSGIRLRAVALIPPPPFGSYFRQEQRREDFVDS
jgi:hypothetical protein